MAGAFNGEVRLRIGIVIGLAAVLAAVAGLPTAGQPNKAPARARNSIGMEFVRIGPGSFQMGSERGDDDERPVHQVTLSKAFELQTTEVTQAQWEAVMGTNPSGFKGPDRPVEQVSWNDVQAFLAKLNAKENTNRYRLPTEAEWEYACRAGGLEPDAAPDLNAVAWSAANSANATQPVGRKKPNAWGLYDMRGNVWEWVQDWIGPYAPGAETDPQGARGGSKYRGMRGGSWRLDVLTRFRCAYRGGAEPNHRSNSIGFRCARGL